MRPIQPRRLCSRFRPLSCLIEIAAAPGSGTDASDGVIQLGKTIVVPFGLSICPGPAGPAAVDAQIDVIARNAAEHAPGAPLPPTKSFTGFTQNISRLAQHPAELAGDGLQIAEVCATVRS